MFNNKTKQNTKMQKEYPKYPEFIIHTTKYQRIEINQYTNKQIQKYKHNTQNNKNIKITQKLQIPKYNKNTTIQRLPKLQQYYKITKNTGQFNRTYKKLINKNVKNDIK